jgi:hypothetical protein
MAQKRTVYYGIEGPSGDFLIFNLSVPEGKDFRMEGYFFWEFFPVFFWDFFPVFWWKEGARKEGRKEGMGEGSKKTNRDQKKQIRIKKNK